MGSSFKWYVKNICALDIASKTEYYLLTFLWKKGIVVEF